MTSKKITQKYGATSLLTSKCAISASKMSANAETANGARFALTFATTQLR
jgi:hypothetical protein